MTQLVPFDRCESLRVAAGVRRSSNGLEFTYEIGGQTDQVVVPARASAPGRGDRLWQGTCFLAYVPIGKTSYVELDFSPSREWAAYRFTNYRQAMSVFELPPPTVQFAASQLTALVELPHDASASAPIGLAAVIEHKSGTRSYWALAHPRANRPDFHARDCFVAELP